MLMERAGYYYGTLGKNCAEGLLLADTVERVGFEKAEAMILGDDLTKRKAEILGLKVTGGATC